LIKLIQKINSKINSKNNLILIGNSKRGKWRFGRNKINFTKNKRI